MNPLMLSAYPPGLFMFPALFNGLLQWLWFGNMVRSLECFLEGTLLGHGKVEVSLSLHPVDAGITSVSKMKLGSFAVNFLNCSGGFSVLLKGCHILLVPLLGGAFCACTWHFFYNSESLEVLVALQAALTVLGNATIFLIYVKKHYMTNFVTYRT
ncbi:hypothetical protein K7X08_029312 [Anisodus acutangulus]|uniref:Uncharacterized protein n=1 Tax=Anisodus acutangulus TaxID=402998 RepID=A0A9Q1QVU5_9SOLA|nr:hypothetical protein K7X08_029312 [Anisodus acutangulus]